MFRIGYAIDGFFNWDRRGMVSGLGIPGDWNGLHSRSPSLLAESDFLLLAFEGWSEDNRSSGIGFLIGLERWLKPHSNLLVFDSSINPVNLLEIGNYGAGDLVIESLYSTNPAFSLDYPQNSHILKPAEKLVIPIRFTPGDRNQLVLGTLHIRSDSVLGRTTVIYLAGY
jgi:hypothetical protein